MESNHKMQRLITIENKLGELEYLRTQASGFLNHAQVSRRIMGIIDLTLEELFINIVSYAYHDNLEHEIAVCLTAHPDRIEVEITDGGQPFDPSTRTTSPLKPAEDLASRKVGGLGILLVRTLMDDIVYHRKHGKNHLKLVKYLERPQEICC